MDWTNITENAEVRQLLEQRKEIEDKIKSIDENALVMYELEVLSMPDVVGRSEQLCDCKKHSIKTNYGFEICTKCGNEFND
jgi:hypothetical protein